VNRRDLLGGALLSPFHRKRRHVTQPWSNQAIALVVIQAGTGFTGLFVYNGAPALGNLRAAIAAQAGTDPEGNTYPAQISTTDGTTLINMAGHGLQWATPSDAAANPPLIFAVPSHANGNEMQMSTAQGTLGQLAASLTLADSQAAPGITGSSPGLPVMFVSSGMPIVSDSFHAVSFQNGWSNSGSGPNMEYRFNPANGKVDVIGDMNAGTLTSPTTIFTLPAAYRPANQQSCLPVASGGGAGLTVGTSRFVFNANGTVTATGMAGFAAGGRLFMNYSLDLTA
jgi:hypothetical protein